MTAVVQSTEWWGATYGPPTDSEITGWHGRIIWTDQQFELSSGDNNEVETAAVICRMLFCQGTMPVPRWRGVVTGSEIVPEAEAAEIFASMEGNWSLQFVDEQQLEATEDRGFYQRYLEADISANNLTMAGGQHYWRKVTRRTNKPTGKNATTNILDVQKSKKAGVGANRKVRSGNRPNPNATLDMILIRPHPSTDEPDNAYYIDGRGSILVIQSPTEMLLKPYKGSADSRERGISADDWREGQYDVVMTKTEKGVGNFDEMEPASEEEEEAADEE
jgi:hypothetical protein